jgi:serine O-acetyltransferase
VTARITSKQSYREFLAADLLAHNLGRWTLYRRLTHPELHYQRVLRRVEYLATRTDLLRRVWYAWSRYRLARVSLQTGISVPPGVFGPGLSIAHYGSIVVNDQARVGAFCRLHSATNIGVADGRAPVLGDRVYVGPGAVLFGGITVGDDVAVGANSVVNRDVPSGVTVAGVPARVVSELGSAAVMPAWFPGPPSSR